MTALLPVNKELKPASNMRTDPRISARRRQSRMWSPGRKPNVLASVRRAINLLGLVACDEHILMVSLEALIDLVQAALP